MKKSLSIQIGPFANWSALHIAGYGSAEAFINAESAHPDFEILSEGPERTKALTDAYNKAAEAVKAHEAAEDDSKKEVPKGKPKA